MVLNLPRRVSDETVFVSPIRQSASGAFECDTHVPSNALGPLVAAAASATAWRDVRLVRELQQFTASRTQRLKGNIGSRSHELVVRWITRVDLTTVAWTVYDTASQFRRVLDTHSMQLFGEALVDSLRHYKHIIDWTPPRLHNPIVLPGLVWSGEAYTGDLYDYSRLARPESLDDLGAGIFSLGSYAFPGFPAPPLYISERPEPRSRELLRNRGILLCAPTRAGKTSLILQWAESAIANGFSSVILDPKGSLLPKLKGRLARRGVDADLYYFTTDQRFKSSDTINFLEGLSCLTEADTDRERLRQIVAALLPRITKSKDEENFRRDLHRDWAFAIIMILKLAEHHFPDDFKTTAGETQVRRPVDLADLYRLAASEDELIRFIGAIRKREEEIEALGRTLDVDSVEEHVTALAAALDPAKLPDIGKRKEGEFYESYSQPMRLALRPFGRGGSLNNRIGSRPDRRHFSFDMLGKRDHPVTLVLAAREQDEEPADAVLRLAITRLRHMVLDRTPTEGYVPPEPYGNLVLFLDETSRVEAFDAAKYFEIAAEAGVTSVVVYQSLERIGDEKVMNAVMRNVGLQIYLGSVRGADEHILNKYMGEREREDGSTTISWGDGGQTVAHSKQRRQGAFFPSPTLDRFPAGKYPALVVMNDERHAPFVTDMFDPSLSEGTP